MADFRADLGDVLEGQDGQQVIETLKSLVKAEGNRMVECSRCGATNKVKVMDSKTVLEAVKWITDQTQGKPQPAAPPTVASGLTLQEMTDEELRAASALSEGDWEAFREWLGSRPSPIAA